MMTSLLLCQPISVYVYKYAQLHYLSSGHRAHLENYPFAIQEFISSLETILRRMVAKKYTDHRSKSNTLQDTFNLTEDMSEKMQEAESFKHNASYRLPTDVNGICGSSAEIN